MASNVTYGTYFYFFYAFEICGISLVFCLIYEIFTSVLEPYDALNKIAKRLLFSVVFCLIVIGLILARYGSGAAIDRVSNVIFVSVRRLRLIQAGGAARPVLPCESAGPNVAKLHFRYRTWIRHLCHSRFESSSGADVLWEFDRSNAVFVSNRRLNAHGRNLDLLLPAER